MKFQIIFALTAFLATSVEAVTIEAAPAVEEDDE